MTILGAVLAGGQSRRFGSDKGQAVWRDRPLIAHVIDILALQVDALVVCGRDMPGQRCVADRPAPGLGPLGGICAALRHAADHDFVWVLSMPCDVPALSSDILRSLLAPAVPAYLAGLPVIGLWPSTAAGALERRLAAGGSRAVRDWASDIGATPLHPPPATLPVNVNTRDDLARLGDRS